MELFMLQISNEIPEVVTIKDCPQYCPFITEKGLRWKLFRDEVFRSRCSKKVGRRRYLLPREIIAFVLEQGS
jgi:hypothetical protein